MRARPHQLFLIERSWRNCRDWRGPAGDRRLAQVYSFGRTHPFHSAKIPWTANTIIHVARHLDRFAFYSIYLAYFALALIFVEVSQFNFTALSLLAFATNCIYYFALSLVPYPWPQPLATNCLLAKRLEQQKAQHLALWFCDFFSDISSSAWQNHCSFSPQWRSRSVCRSFSPG